MGKDTKSVYVLSVKSSEYDRAWKHVYIDKDKAKKAAGEAAAEGYEVSLETCAVYH